MATDRNAARCSDFLFAVTRMVVPDERIASETHDRPHKASPRMMRGRVCWLVGLLLLLSPCAAAADWIFAPFVGSAFGGSTALPDLEQGASSAHLIFGGTVGWWSQGILGIESDFSFAPHFFETDNTTEVITSSNVITLGGNVVVAVPLSVTRESLRPYLVGGLSWMHASIDDVRGLLPELFGRTRNSVGVNFGGGAIGLITPRTGLRFEVRHFGSLEREEDRFSRETESLLSFWRATVGVVIQR
jgi:hypothetical protein